MSVVDPAAHQVEEVHRDGKVKALFPSTDEKPQTQGTATAMRLSAARHRLAFNPWDQNLVRLHLSSRRHKTKKRRNILPCQRVQDERHHGNSALHGCKTKDLSEKVAFQHVYTQMSEKRNQILLHN